MKNSLSKVAFAVLLVVLGVLVFGYQDAKRVKTHHIYINVFSPEHEVFLEDVSMIFSQPGITKKILSGAPYAWEFETTAKPGTKINLRVKGKNVFWVADQDLVVSKDSEQGLDVQMHHDQSAKIRGVILGNTSQRISGAILAVNQTYSAELSKTSVISDKNGYFEFPIGVGDNEQVRLTVHAGPCHTDEYYYVSVDRPLTVYLQCDK